MDQPARPAVHQGQSRRDQGVIGRAKADFLGKRQTKATQPAGIASMAPRVDIGFAHDSGVA